MKTYNPACKITLVKAQKRTVLADYVSAAGRYAALDNIDLTPFVMADGGVVQTSKSVREPAGGFSLTIPDQPYKDKGTAETVYALVEPMDYIEIRMARNPGDYGSGKYGIVMRGLVSQVNRSTAMQGGRPVRAVTIAGQDMGKIWQIIQIYFLNNAVIGQYHLSALAYFNRYAVPGEAKILPAADYINSVLTHVINPFVGDLAALAKPPNGSEVVKSWTPKVSIQGMVSPYQIASFQDVSMYSMMAKLLDVGPFNELFTQDDEAGVNLVARPAPFKNLTSGKFIQDGAAADSAIVPSEDIESISTSRSDASVANFYWVSSGPWFSYSNQTSKEQANIGNAADFILSDYVNTKDKYYGFRKMETEVILGPENFTSIDAPKAAELDAQTTILGAWLAARRKVLAEINKDAVVFEFGNIAMKGNEKLKPGSYVTVKQGLSQAATMEVYAHTVSHEFQPYSGNFRTSVAFDRGTGWVMRARQQTPQYRREIDAGGVRSA